MKKVQKKVKTVLRTNTLSFSIESLFSSAFARTKDRFILFFLAEIFNIVIVLGYILASVVVDAVFLVPLAFAKQTILVTFIGAILIIGELIGLIFVSLWVRLSLVKLMIQEPKKGIMETLKEVKPLVVGYFWFMLLQQLFFFGLLPFGLISLSVVWIIWAVWSLFGTIIYLEMKKAGLENVWYSKAMITPYFWPVLLRCAILFVLIFLVTIVLGLLGGVRQGGVYQLLNLVITPFFIAFGYEMYKVLEKPKVVKTPVMWIILSVVGLFITIGGIAFLVNTLSHMPPEFWQQFQKGMNTPHTV